MYYLDSGSNSCAPIFTVQPRFFFFPFFSHRKNAIPGSVSIGENKKNKIN